MDFFLIGYLTKAIYINEAQLCFFIIANLMDLTLYKVKDYEII